MRTVRYLPCLLTALWLAGCVGRQAPPTRTPPPAPMARRTTATTPNGGKVHLTNYRIQFPNEGAPVWVADVKQADVKSGAAIAEGSELGLHGVTCTMFHDGQETLRVTSDTGSATLRGRVAQVKLYGHVRAHAVGRGYQLDANAMSWSSREDRVSATGVRWLGEGFAHRADSGVFSATLTRGAFRGNVQTQTTF